MNASQGVMMKGARIGTGRGRRCARFILQICFFVTTGFVILMFMYHNTLKMYMGVAVFAPSLVHNRTIAQVASQTCSTYKIHPPNQAVPFNNPTSVSMSTPNNNRTIPNFDDFIRDSNDIDGVNQFALSRDWTVLPDNDCINTSHLDSNVCIRQKKIRSYDNNDEELRCLPSFMIIGFEKCSTTQLLLWLSYHPNLLGKWQETRFFSHVPKKDNLEGMWKKYLQEQLPVPGGINNVGKYWNYEKTPSSILSTEVPNLVNIITPMMKLIVMVRNPTLRALSAFVMYTRHVNNYNEFSATWDIDKIMYSSYVIRNINTGQVKFAKKGGNGGDIATQEQLKRYDRGVGPWRYISYPPSPQDFHDFIMTNRNMSERYGQFHFNCRESRVIQEGFYAKFMNNWLDVFPRHQFLVIPMESLWNKNTIANLNALQRKLGIPVFDYSKVTFVDKKTNRHELKSASTYFLWQMFNTGNDVIKMLPESKQYLDDMYCESNRHLKRMLPSSSLKGYSCT